MMLRFRTLFVIALLCSTLSLVAQEDVPSPVGPKLDNGTVQEQFDYMMKNSNRYQIYKVVRTEWLNKFQANVSDSLGQMRGELKTLTSDVDNHLGEIDRLKNELAKIHTDLETLQNEKDSIRFMGTLMEKSTYKSMMWGIVGVLLLIGVLFFGLFKRSNSVTSKTKERLNEVQEEFEQHRKRAIEREQKLARQLHVAQNKGRNF